MEHDWKPNNKLFICKECGIVGTVKNRRESCPPWSSTDEGDTNTKRVHEAGEVESLKIILNQVVFLKEAIIGNVPRLRKAAITTIENNLKTLIQKHEGLNKS